MTIDAMRAQREICEQIVGQFGDYVISLKQNQVILHEDVQLFLSDPSHHEETNKNNDKGRDRLEKRIAAVNS